MNGNQDQQPEWGYIKSPTPPAPPQQGNPNGQWNQTPPPAPPWQGQPNSQWPQAPPSPNYQPGPYPPQQQYGQPPQQSSYYYPVAGSLPKGMSIASLVLGLLSLLLAPFITGVLAAILGGIAIGRCNRDEAGGKGMAIAGVILGIIGIVGWVILLAALGPDMGDFEVQ